MSLDDQNAALALAVNHAVQDFALSRMRQSLVGGGASLDSKRPQSWCEFGFSETLQFSDFYQLYRRGGIAHGAVNKLVGTCWKTQPWMVEGDEDDRADQETEWERKTGAVIKRSNLWAAFREADKRRLVGRYSGLVLHFSDKKAWREPVVGTADLLKLTPVWESNLRAVERDEFDNPTLWEYLGAGNKTEDIHPDRVFILGDPAPDAIAFLEPVFNNFVSMEKVEGGSGESFLKNAARQLNVDFDKEVDLNQIAALYGVPVSELHKRFNDAARDVNRANDLLLITQGATTTPLVSSVPDPRPTYDINLQTVSAGLDIPSRVLVGNQQGERASKEDREYFHNRCQSRRVSELSGEIEALMSRLMAVRAIPPKDDFSAMWDDLAASTPGDKLADAKTMAEINAASFDGSDVFTPDEIRDAAGYAALEARDPLGELDDAALEG